MKKMINETDIEAMNPGFYAWLDEVEGFATRSERLYDDFSEVKDLKRLREWLESAFNVGYATAVKEPRVYVDVEV
jgi:hypothetical protein